jgi:dTDP-glucose 4,6-dehydratase
MELRRHCGGSNKLTERVLVTGADGFIGSHLVERLVREGYAVRAFVHYHSLGARGWLDHAASDVIRDVDVVAGDIRDPHSVRRAVHDCDVVLHLAALIGIPYSYHSPDSYVDTNVKGTLNVLQAAMESGVRRLVHTSTSEVYGSAQRVPVDETHPLQAQSPYAATKIAADQLALSFHRSFGAPVTLLRPFNTYGPRQSSRAVIPTVISQLAANRRRVRLGALSPTRDFSFVDDTVGGFLAAARSDAALGEVVNLGTGFEISIADTAKLIAEVMEMEIELEPDEARLRPAASEVDRLVSDNGKARELLGWEPTHRGREGLRAGLAATVRWLTVRENLSRYRVDDYGV